MIYLSGVRHPDLAVITTPSSHGHEPFDGQIWAADNGRFAAPHKYTDEKYLAWLERLRPWQHNCLFATAPDVVQDAATTLELSWPMFQPIRELGYRVALVGQDGMEDFALPWDEFDAFFIGGSTEWKMGEAVRQLVAQAKAYGKWVHNGRVNSLKRYRYSEQIGCDSADGTAIKFRPRARLAEVKSWIAHVDMNPSIWRVTA